MNLDQARQNHLDNITKRTGKSLDALAAIVQKSGLSKHGEIVAMLKEKLGIGHGDANAVAHYAKSLDAAGTPPAVASPNAATDEIYSGPKAALRPIHDAVMAKLAAFGEFEIAPKKAYLSLRRNKQFAMIGPGTKTRVDIGINLKDAKGTDRIVEQPAGGMCQFKVGVTNVAEVDKELMTWLKKAFDVAG
ncbi:MAG TPA: DUF5655 domain-containing protein [Fimbriiglobus sp.]|jgi:hypothetical protein